jgi:aryl-alcohol dehydrogenase-like predicted oxidoreductase
VIAQRPLGATGLRVSELALGTWAFGGDEWGPADDGSATATIHAALDAGVTLFDTADVYGYGHSEELLGRALAGRDVLVCSKAGNDIYETPRQAGGGPKRFSAGYLARAIDGSLARLGRDAIDVYLLHNPSEEVLTDGGAMGALQDARAAGRVRLIGASVYTAAEGMAAIEAGADVVMITHSLVSHTESTLLIDHASARGVGVLVRSVLANGLLGGKYDAASEFGDDDHRSHRGAEWLRAGASRASALRPLAEARGVTLPQLAIGYAIADPRVSSAVIGARSLDQLAENLAAQPLDAATVEAAESV